jgi:hypothetical protein
MFMLEDKSLGLNCVDQVTEGRLIAYSDVCQDFPIHFDIIFLKGMDKAAIVDAIAAGGGVNAGNPQATQIPTAISAIPIGVPQAFHHGFVGAAEQLMLGIPLPFGVLQNLLVTTAGNNTPFYT